MKAITERTFAVFVGFIIALVLIYLMSEWVISSGESSERERNQIISAAGCLAENNCEHQASNKACIHTIDGENLCGCRSWKGIENNPDCASGQRCVSPRGANYGSCA